MGVWRSLQNRIAIVATTVTFLILLLVAGLVLVAQQRQLDAAVDTALEAEIADVQQAFGVTFRPRPNDADSDSRRRPGVDRLALRRFAQNSNNNFQLVARNGVVLLGSGRFSESEPIVEPDLLFDEGGDGSFRTVSDTNDRRFRVVSANAGPDVALVVGYSLADVDEAQNALRRTLILVLPFLAALLGMLIWFFVGRALAPVDRMQREVDRISPADLQMRVSTPDTEELSSLASTMNSMLDRIETAVAKQQRFVADASHELRSPLTGIRGQLEVNVAHPDAPGRDEADREALEETIRMQALVEDLLALARSDQGRQHTPMELVDLDDLVMAEASRQRASARVPIDLSKVAPVQISGNPDQLRRLTRNLLSNALRHARSTVKVSVVRLENRVELAVEDDGAGVPTELRAGVFERFVRSDDARDRDSGGSGLGLAICRSIAEAHGGEIALEGGSRFVVSFGQPKSE